MKTYQLLATRRTEELLDTHSSYERPADLIADLIHYCNYHGELFDFEEELRVARLYVDDEQREDAESDLHDSE
jgi:hypothetical protein